MNNEFKKTDERINRAKTDYASSIAPLSENEEEFDHLAMELAHYFLNDDHYEYSDHLRIARHDRPETMEEYLNIHKQGCCGYVDRMTICSKGLRGSVMFMVGFNYGH